MTMVPLTDFQWKSISSEKQGSQLKLLLVKKVGKLVVTRCYRWPYSCQNLSEPLLFLLVKLRSIDRSFILVSWENWYFNLRLKFRKQIVFILSSFTILLNKLLITICLRSMYTMNCFQNIHSKSIQGSPYHYKSAHCTTKAHAIPYIDQFNPLQRMLDRGDRNMRQLLFGLTTK